MLHFIDFIAHRPIFHKIADSLLCSFHNIFKFRLFVHRQSQAGQRNKQVACTTLEPGVACKYIMLLSLFVMELVGRIFQYSGRSYPAEYGLPLPPQRSVSVCAAKSPRYLLRTQCFHLSLCPLQNNPGRTNLH